MEKITVLQIGLEGLTLAVEGKSLTSRALESIDEVSQLSSLTELMHSPLVVLINIAHIEDPCIACFNLGLIYDNGVPVLFIPIGTGNSRFLPKCLFRKSCISNVFDFHKRKTEIPPRFLTDIQDFFFRLDRYFQTYTLPSELIEEISGKEGALDNAEKELSEAKEKHDSIEESRLEKEISRYHGEITRMKDELNHRISVGLNSFIGSAELVSREGNDDEKKGFVPRV